MDDISQVSRSNKNHGSVPSRPSIDALSRTHVKVWAWSLDPSQTGSIKRNTRLIKKFLKIEKGTCLNSLSLKIHIMYYRNNT